MGEVQVGGPLPPTLTRRQVLLATAGVIGMAACSGDAKPNAGGSAPQSSPSAAPADVEPVRGGTLVVGIVGGSNDIIDGQYVSAKPDIARLVTGWESLLTYDENFKVTHDGGLAEEVDSTSADRYVIRVREGVEFHNGKTLGADDVICSFRRAIDRETGINPVLAKLVDPQGIRKIDARTVAFDLVQPAVTFLDNLALYALGMVPDGYSRDDHEQVGTGPFKLVSFTPGSESRHVRHENYWQSPGPYLDGVDIVDFLDGTALVNALLAGQIDCACDVPFAQVPVIQGRDDLQILESEGGTWFPLTMAVDEAPFDDVRVRRAFRLIVDRPEVVERVLSGHGRVANDLFAPLDGCYLRDLPQREQDLEQARALLHEAGHDQLEIDLYAPNDVAGLADLAAVFADHAKKADVTVNVHVLPGADYWPGVGQRTFAIEFWGTRNYLVQVPLSHLHDAISPETHWPPAGSDFADEYLQAIATTDEAARCKIVRAMQREQFDDGGDIIACFSNLVDAHKDSVHGLVARPNTLNLDHYGHGFRNVWIAP